MKMRTSDLLFAKITPIKPARMTHSYRTSCQLVNKLHSTGMCDVKGCSGIAASEIRDAPFLTSLNVYMYSAQPN